MGRPALGLQETLSLVGKKKKLPTRTSSPRDKNEKKSDLKVVGRPWRSALRILRGNLFKNKIRLRCIGR